MKTKKSILVFGGGELQVSIINECFISGYFVVVIDPDPNAKAAKIADAFEVIDGNDFEGTCNIIEKYNIDAIVTAATDKPLVMMAKVAEKYGLTFFSRETAVFSTDKFLMKQIFLENNIPCANGFLIKKEFSGDVKYPVIIKPRDNSGSRGVIYCPDEHSIKQHIDECFLQTKLDTVLCEEVITGKEYSIEAIHYDNLTRIIQITEKITTAFPYNVELGHIQPADIKPEAAAEVSNIINKISESFCYENCVSHTEIKINENGVFVIETSPRLGGDFITSDLVPLSTGVNIESKLLEIATNNDIGDLTKINKASAIFYFDESAMLDASRLKQIAGIDGVVKVHYNFECKKTKIKNSLDRNGYVIIKSEDREHLLSIRNDIFNLIESNY